MKNYTIVSKTALIVCLDLAILVVANGITGFINSTISFSGTAICIVGFFIAIFTITILEKERAKRKQGKF